jgi:hypothetical protein
VEPTVELPQRSLLQFDAGFAVVFHDLLSL